MKISGFYPESMSNGEGYRAVLFVSGCPHHCQGCHNKETQDPNYGVPFTKEKKAEILAQIAENSILKGITLSGGEPLCPLNIAESLNFIKDVKALRPEFDVWCYSGYTYEQLLERSDETTQELLKNVDVLVDGPFKAEAKEPNLRFKGSSNQRIIDLPKSLFSQEIIDFKFQSYLDFA